MDTIHLDLAPLAGALGQRLRAAGVPVTAERSAGFARALTLVRPNSRRRLYWTARSVFVSDQSQARRSTRCSARSSAPGGRRGEEPVEQPESEPADRRRRRRRRESWGGAATSPGRAGEDGRRADADVPLALASDEERLAGKRFDALDPHELAQLYRLMTRLELATPLRRTRRYERGRHGQRIDMRRTLRASLRSGGDPIRLARRRRRTVPRRLVMLCDISGSMEPYGRAYLQFLACAARSGPHAEAFAFATRLTRLTRALGSRHPERAIERAAIAAPDWSSGTRIGDALKQFNDRHGRRGMARGAVVVILSDGWERGDPELMGREMERLSRLAHRIVWVNPRVSAPRVLGAGRRDGGRARALRRARERSQLPRARRGGGRDRSGLMDGPARAGRDLRGASGGGGEPWASATPVPGSSVAMPSGYGPSKGNTTPGWGER